MNQKSHPPPGKKKSLNVYGSVTSGSIYKVVTPWYARKKNGTGAYDFSPPSYFLVSLICCRRKLLCFSSLTPVTSRGVASPPLKA